MGSQSVVSNSWLVIIVVLIMWNLMAFILMGMDKYRAQHNRWRIPEARLMGVALFGGALGMLMGMQIFHHKTKHAKFTIGVPLCLILNLVFAYGLWTVLK